MSKYSDNRPDTAFTIAAHDIGMILSHGDNHFDGYGIRQALVFEHDGKYIMHYDGSDDIIGWSAYRAVSTDLLHWTKEGKILNPGKKGETNAQYDCSGAVYLYPYYENGIWHAFYIGSNCVIKHPYDIMSFPYITLKAKATSAYGPWTKEDVLPFYMKEGTYYDTTASSGVVVKDKNEYLQFFSASSDRPGIGTKRTLGIARTHDLSGVWTVDETPLFPLEEQIENSAIYFQQETQTWFLFTNHVGINNDGEYTDAIWVYWTQDIQKWHVHQKALVFDSSMSIWSKNVIGAPSVVCRDHKLYIFYDGVRGDTTTHYHRDIGVASLDLPIIVPKL